LRPRSVRPSDRSGSEALSSTHDPNATPRRSVSMMGWPVSMMDWPYILKHCLKGLIEGTVTTEILSSRKLKRERQDREMPTASRKNKKCRAVELNDIVEFNIRVPPSSHSVRFPAP
jgi:hypothetical protein